jgi:thymidylate kinase
MAFVVGFEGMGGCGKTSQADFLYSYFIDKGFKVEKAKGGGAGEPDERLKAVILAIRSKPDFVVLDRTPYTALVTSINDPSDSVLKKISDDSFNNFPKIDLIILLDSDPKIAMERNKLKKNPSIYDLSSALSVKEMRRFTYLKIAKKEGWIVLGVDKKSSKEVHKAVIKHLPLEARA